MANYVFPWHQLLENILYFLEMRLIRTGHNKVEIQRNKRHGKKLIVKWIHPERASHRCIWCSLVAYCCSVYYKPCDEFLPEHIFFIDEDKINKRGKIRGKKK
jgi:hypothetical protein